MNTCNGECLKQCWCKCYNEETDEDYEVCVCGHIKCLIFLIIVVPCVVIQMLGQESIGIKIYFHNIYLSLKTHLKK